jgi:hypothetical protein
MPLLTSFALTLRGVLVLNLGILSEARSRTRLARAPTAVNLGFALVLGSALALHSQFAKDLVSHRDSRARSSANLEGEVTGRWELIARTAPPGGSWFPARAFDFEPGGRVRLSRGTDPTVLHH